MRDPRQSKIRPGMVAAAVLTTFALALSACSSSSSDDKSSAAAPPPGSGSVAAGSDVVASATTALAEGIKDPTKTGVTEALKTKPKPGGLMIYMDCGLATCKAPGDGMKAAVEKIGWKFRSITYQYANPQTLVGAMQQALTYKPTAVVVPSTPVQVWQGVIPAYKQANVKIVPIFQGAYAAQEPLLGNLAGPDDVAGSAALVSNWFIANSKGKGKALLVSVPDVPSEKEFGDSVKADVKKCSGCSLSELNLTTAQLTEGTGTTAAISALQRDSSITYVLNGYGPQLAGFGGALAAAGLADRVRVGGYSGSAAEYAGVKAGQYDAYTAYNSKYIGWQCVDIVLRDQQGIAFKPTDGGLPIRLFVTGSDFKVDDAANFDAPAGYPEAFAKLWLVG